MKTSIQQMLELLLSKQISLKLFDNYVILCKTTEFPLQWPRHTLHTDLFDIHPKERCNQELGDSLSK